MTPLESRGFEVLCPIEPIAAEMRYPRAAATAGYGLVSELLYVVVRLKAHPCRRTDVYQKRVRSQDFASRV